MGSYANLAVRDASGNIIGYQSTSTGQTSAGTGDINYDNPITAATYAGSAAFQAIQSQYAQQHYANVSSSGTTLAAATGLPSANYDTTTAAGIAALVGSSGGTVDVNLAKKAVSEGIPASSIAVLSSAGTPVSYASVLSGAVSADTGIHTIETPKIYDSLTLPSSSTGTSSSILGTLKQFSQLTGINVLGEEGTVTTYVPYGSYKQTELLNTKLAVDPLTGELAIYQKPYGHSQYELIGGGGRAALQSGMFSISSALTPAVYTQESAGTKFASSANVSAATSLLADTGTYSRLGAEVYGGFVSKLTGATIESTGAKLSTYADARNLANLSVPTGVNLTKTEAPGAAIPWTISTESPAISVMGPTGLLGGITTPSSTAKGGSQVLASSYDVTYKNLPAPFRSSVGSTEIVKPTGEIFGVKIPLASDVLAFFEPGKAVTARTSVSNIPEVTTLKGTTTEIIPGGTLTTQLFETTGGKTETKTTTEVATPSAFEILSKSVAEATTMKILPDLSRTTKESMASGVEVASAFIPGMQALTLNPIAGKQASEFIGGMVVGEYTGLRERPLETIGSYAIGAGLGVAFKGLEVVGSKAAASAVGEYPQLTKALTILNATILPSAIASLYAVDVSSRVTEGFTTFAPSTTGVKFGTILATETIPMIAGGYAGYKVVDFAVSKAPQLKSTVTEMSSVMAGEPGITIKAPSTEYTPFTGKTFLERVSSKIPTAEQIKTKLVEWKTPETAMSSGVSSERFATAGRFATEPIKSGRFVESSRASAREGTRTRSGGFGTVSTKETPRQMSLKMNFDPLAALTEIKSNLLGSATGKYEAATSGLRGTLRGRWDIARVSTEEALKGIPLKERWKMREGTRTESTGGYYGGGKPGGTLQSGVGEFGTTVRSGRGGQVLELRGLSSGISGAEQAPAPAALDLYPSKRSALRSRAYELEYEYEPRRLPEGMARPTGSSGTAVDIQERQIAGTKFTGFGIAALSSQRLKQTSESITKSATELMLESRSRMEVIPKQISGSISVQKQSIEQRLRSDQITTQLQRASTRQEQRPRLDVTSVSIQKELQRTLEKQRQGATTIPRTITTITPRQITTQTPYETTITTPKITTIKTPKIIPFGNASISGAPGPSGGIGKRFRKFAETYNVGSFEVTAGGIFGSRKRRK
jgi:hypothetical protein